MKSLVQLLKWDAILFNRNRLFLLSLVVAIIYTGLFYLLKPLGSLDTILVVLIFNDPVVTGYLFAGILLLFDKSQHTLQAIAVLPIPFRQYLLSKTILLSVVATFTALIMTIATRGMDFNWAHLLVGVFLSAFIFSLIGFSIGAMINGFNQLLIYSVPFLVLCAIPLLPVFGFGRPEYFFLLPSTGGIQLLRASFDEQDGIITLLSYGHLLAWTFTSWRVAVFVTGKKIV